MSAPLVNKRNIERYIGQRVKLICKYSAPNNVSNDGFIVVMGSAGSEVKCRLQQGIHKPIDAGNGGVRVLSVTGRVEADGSVSVDAPLTDLGTEIDMNLLDEAINLQFRKEFSHLFYSPVAPTSYA